MARRGGAAHDVGTALSPRALCIALLPGGVTAGVETPAPGYP